MLLKQGLGGGEKQRVTWPDQATQVLPLCPPFCRGVLQQLHEGRKTVNWRSSPNDFDSLVYALCVIGCD